MLKKTIINCSGKDRPHNFWQFLTDCISKMPKPNLINKKDFLRQFFVELEPGINLNSSLIFRDKKKVLQIS